MLAFPFFRRLAGTVLAALLLVLAWPAQARIAHVLDDQPRIAVVSAFEPELAVLRQQVQQPRSHTVNGVTFTTGTLQGKPVLLFLSGISMTNAAMTTQLALNRFNISHILFSGIAGGVDPALHLGDVLVAERWGQYLEVLMARQTRPGVFDPMDMDNELKLPNFDMLYTRPVEVRSAAHPKLHKQFWFEVDPAMLKVARSLQGLKLGACNAQQRCLQRQPQLVVGGNGVSGSAFVDNAEMREHLAQAFQARVVDMESAACAMVAYANDVPFLALRSLSDLAGGGPGANEIHTFLSLAADNSAKVVLAFLQAWK